MVNVVASRSKPLIPESLLVELKYTARFIHLPLNHISFCILVHKRANDENASSIVPANVVRFLIEPIPGRTEKSCL